MSPRSLAASVVALVTGLGLVVAPAGHAAPVPEQPRISWTVCGKDPAVRCGSLRLPVDWSQPDGATFELAVARRAARKPASQTADQPESNTPGRPEGSTAGKSANHTADQPESNTAGQPANHTADQPESNTAGQPANDAAGHQGGSAPTLIFGPGGPGDSGVDRILAGDRFSPEILDRFDTVSFDPRGVARSGGPKCDLSIGKPGLLTSQAEFDAAGAGNQARWAACRSTSPVWEHADTASAVRDLDALRAALGLRQLTFHGSSYGTLLGQQYAERYPGRVRAIVLESVFDHSIDVRQFVRTQALAAQDGFDEFVSWCGRNTKCALHGEDVRAVWNDVLRNNPARAFEIAMLPIARLASPDRAALAEDIASLRDGATPEIKLPPIVSSVFCADWPAAVRDFGEYQQLVRIARRAAPDVRYGAGLLAIRACLGWPQPVANPPHRLDVHTGTPLLLLNSRHDVRTGYVWATHVAAQLGRHGRLVTYEGSGHGAYGNTPCTTAAVDRYLIDLVVPPRGASCPA